MKVYISADIEGVSGIAHFDEAIKSHADYAEFRRQMTVEVAAACNGALAAGATEIVVKDAHGTARNLVAGDLPRPTRLIRGWSGDPFLMVQDLDASFDALAFVGYHARAGAGGNPLAHTLSSRQLQGVWLNDQPASEYRLHAYAAASVGVPVVFVSGDRTLCEEVHHWQPAVHTFATKWGEGASQQSVHPQDAVAGIASGLEQALTDEQAFSCIALPEFFELEIEYKHHETAFARSFYPGAERVTANRVQFASDDYYEILRSLMFLM